MTAFDRKWLAGYTEATNWLATRRKRDGWAKAKGLVKDLVSDGVKRLPRDPFTAGWSDALLDSVGC